ncbi:unnamed protein product [Prunus armeniaca]
MQATLKLFIAAQNVAAHRETISEKAKVEEELDLVPGRLETEMKKNVKLLSSVNKLTEEKHGLSVHLLKWQKELDGTMQKIDTFSSELRSCYNDVVKDFIKSAEY